MIPNLFLFPLLLMSGIIVSAQFSEEVQNTLSHKHFCSWCELSDSPAAAALNYSVQVYIQKPFDSESILKHMICRGIKMTTIQVEQIQFS